MAQEEPIDKIESHIKEGKNFVLSGGAGSGKTSTLLETFQLFDQTKKIACITYTNTAVEEINERNSAKNVDVFTIHDFLWTQIKHYQKNMKNLLSKKFNINFDLLQKISYESYEKKEKGIISHDTVICLATAMIRIFPLLQQIISSKYQAILVDEYQDTDKRVVQALLEMSKKQKIIIGFFGDSMQAIYDKGIGDLQEQINKQEVYEIQKPDNFRCSKAVILLLNKLRLDSLKQQPSKHNKKGSVKFLYTTRSLPNHITNSFSKDEPNHKKLLLSHRLIAKLLGFEELFKQGYRITGNSVSPIIRHITKIAQVVKMFDEHRHYEILKNIEIKAISTANIKQIFEGINKLKNPNLTIGEAIQLSDTYRLVIKDDFYIKECENHLKVFQNERFSSIQLLLKYEEGLFSIQTQHSTKGREFENVTILLDNGNWKDYDFSKIFTDKQSDLAIRTKKLFYVACSRAKNNLTIIYPNFPQKYLEQAYNLFGKDNVCNIDGCSEANISINLIDNEHQL